MDDLSKKGLYMLVYTPKLTMGESNYYTQIKIGRTGTTFKRRFQGYKGSNKVTHDVVVHLFPLHVPDGCSSYGFEEEEAILKQKIKDFVDCNPAVARTKTALSEHYYVKTERSHKFIKIILDGIEIIKNINSKYKPHVKVVKSQEKEKEKEKEKSFLSSLWRFAYKAK